MNEKERLKKFLEEYARICKKYGYFIDACGCCDSPYISPLEETHIEWEIGHLLDNPDLSFYKDIPLAKIKEKASQLFHEILPDGNKRQIEIASDFDNLEQHVNYSSLKEGACS